MLTTVKHHWLALVILLTLSNCSQAPVCTDPAALNYVAYPKPGGPIDNATCRYGTLNRFAGNFTGIDTFVYRPPTGGNPVNMYSPITVSIYVSGNAVEVSLQEKGVNDTEVVTVNGDSLFFPGGRLFVLVGQNPTVLCLSPEPLSSTTVSYLTKN